MKKNDKSQRTLLILDLLSVTAAFFIAIFIRFSKEVGMGKLAGMYDGLYYLIFELILAIYVAVFFVVESGNKPLKEQDPFEKLMAVTKNQILVSICLIILLYLIKRGYWASRAVVVMLMAFSILIDTVVRIIYGKYLVRKAAEMRKPVRYLLLTESEGAEERTRMINAILEEGDAISDTINVDDISPEGDIPGTLKEFDEVLIYLTDMRDMSEDKRTRFINKLEFPHRYVMNEKGSLITREMVRHIGDTVTFYFSGLLEKCPVLGVNFSVTNLNETLLYIRDNIEALRGKYVCFGNVHTTVMAKESKEYRDIQNGAALVLPDGAPIYAEQRKKGFVKARRVAGPDFMGKAFLSAMDGKLSMYFYGSTEKTIKELEKNLRKEYPGIDLRGFESPPFRDLTEEEDRAAVDRINASGADLVWIGLGAPKQEKWMADHAGKINALMLGVGAGFDFHAHTIDRAPEWIQKIGLEWLYRLFQDPKRLIGRYMITNTKYLIYRFFDR